jgi:DNA helicase II / ATP-dependent DNA helicase PcrA
MIDLSSLNETQRIAVTHSSGPMMILAGAGSGKTRTLVSKISYLINNEKLSSHRILALTFSNKAAKEMRERVSRFVEMDVGALQITTFHAFCAKLLRSEATYLGLSRNFTIYDSAESKSIAKVILSRHGISQKEMSPFEILNYIEGLKNLGHSCDDPLPDGYDELDPLYGYYQEYERELLNANALDFGSLITSVVKLFREFPEVLENYQNRFEYILVDEYQDTNKAQFILLNMLAEKKKNICVVGDEDQSIYSWRGADIYNILDFEKTFPDTYILKLEQNYRSSKNIIEAATYLIERNKMRKGKKMWTDNPEGDAIEIHEVSDDKKEAEFITEEIQKLSKDSQSLNDMAVFYRTNGQSRIIEDYLRRANISYRIVGGIKFYERKEVKDILAYLRLLTNEKDSLAFSRIINTPARGIGATTLRKLEGLAVDKNLSLWGVVELITNSPDDFKSMRLSKNVRARMLEFVTLIQDCKVLIESNDKPSNIYDKIVHESGYVNSLKVKKDYESLARLENLDELKNAIVQYEMSGSSSSLSGFLESVTLDNSNDLISGDTQMNGEVSLMTVHGAKGLEFPYVFISGVEENLFPSFRSMESGDTALEEERRLFYVAMTRAMKKLYIIFAQGRMLFGQLKFNGPSRFIMEIPEKFYKWNKSNTEYNQSNDWDDDFSQDSFQDDVPSYQLGSDYYTYPKGTAVSHAIYGDGVINDVEGTGNEEKVTIKFMDGTRKKFLVKFAPLVKIEE